MVDESGHPKVARGESGLVYRVAGNRERVWGVKLFLGESLGREARYRKLWQHAHDNWLEHLTGFDYLNQGIRLNGEWFPLVKMDWIEGAGLAKCMARHLEDPPALLGLAAHWCSAARYFGRKTS